MNIEGAAWVRMQDIPGTEKWVLMALTWYAHHETFECFPKHKTLAKDTGFGERTVRRALESLVERGLISTVNQHDGTGRQTSNRYKIHIHLEDQYGHSYSYKTAGGGGQRDHPGGHCDQGEVVRETRGRWSERPGGGGQRDRPLSTNNKEEYQKEEYQKEHGGLAPLSPAAQGDDASAEQAILDHLNRATQRKQGFGLTRERKATIKARLKEVGGDVEAVKAMIDFKAKEWRGTEFAKYLTPKTLFRPKNFMEYLEASREAPTSGETPAPIDAREAATLARERRNSLWCRIEGCKTAYVNWNEYSREIEQGIDYDPESPDFEEDRARLRVFMSQWLEAGGNPEWANAILPYLENPPPRPPRANMTRERFAQMLAEAEAEFTKTN